MSEDYNKKVEEFYNQLRKVAGKSENWDELTATEKLNFFQASTIILQIVNYGGINNV